MPETLAGGNMAALNAVTRDGADRVVEAAALAAFEAGFRGNLLRPGAPGYDDARGCGTG